MSPELLDIATEDWKNATMLTWLFQSSKTDQSRIGCTRTVHATGSDLCPVEAYKLLRRMRGSSWRAEDPLLMDRQRNILTRIMISEALKWAATDMGHKASDYASHSLRIGGATALKAAGWDDESIRRFGRWASDCWRRYVYSSRSDLKPVAAAMARANYTLQMSARDFISSERPATTALGA